MADNDQQNPEQPHTTERWAYAGVRFTSSSRRTAEVWVDQAGAGEELWYHGNGTRLILGAIYETQIDRTAKKLTRYGAPRYTGDSIPRDDPRRRAWITADNAARTRRQQVRDEAKDSKREAITEALEALRPYAAACRTRTERDALLATVIRRITDMW